MSKVVPFLAGIAVAALAAGAIHVLVVRPAVGAAEDRAAAAERESLRARRQAADRENWAETERRRREEIERELAEVKRVVGPPQPRDPATPTPRDHGGRAPPPPPAAGMTPENWDMGQIRIEVMLLAETPRAVIQNPRFELVVRAMKAKLDDSIALCASVVNSELDAAHRSVCATLLAKLRDVRAVEPLMKAWSGAADENLRAALLRALADIPGTAQTPVLSAVWGDPTSPPILRLMAIHGLARRRDKVAMRIATSGGEGSTPNLRLQALNSLALDADEGGFTDTSLVPVFGDALLSADGPEQQRLCLRTLEQFWAKESLAALEEFAEKSGTSDLAARARKLINSLKAGEPRPASAEPAAPGPTDPPAAPAHGGR